MRTGSTQDIAQRLAVLPLAEGMPADTLGALAQIAHLQVYPVGRIIFNESEQHKRLHLIYQGIVTLEMRIPGHGLQKILSVGPGELLAWSALLADGIMTTSAIVAETVEAIDFDTDVLKELCERNHEVGYYLMRHVAIGLSKRLLATRLQLLDLFRN